MASNLLGLRTAITRLRQLPERLNRARNEALDEWARGLEKTARDLAPKRLGTLEGSINAHVNRGSGKAWVQVDGTKARQYAYYVEKGTSKMTAQPFMGPAAQIHRRSGERAVRRAARRRLGRW